MSIPEEILAHKKGRSLAEGLSDPRMSGKPPELVSVEVTASLSTAQERNVRAQRHWRMAQRELQRPASLTL